MTIYRARIEFLPSCHIMYKNKNNIHVRFASAQPHSLQLSGGKNDLFSPSPLRGSGRKCHFCLPQAEVNSVVPRQNGRECYIFSFFSINWKLHKCTVTSLCSIAGKIGSHHFELGHPNFHHMKHRSQVAFSWFIGTLLWFPVQLHMNYGLFFFVSNQVVICSSTILSNVNVPDNDCSFFQPLFFHITRPSAGRLLSFFVIMSTQRRLLLHPFSR